MIPYGDSLGNMLYVNKAQWHARCGSNTMKEQFMLEWNNIMSRWRILVCNTKLQTILLWKFEQNKNEFLFGNRKEQF